MVEKKEVAIPVPAADNSPMEEDKPLKKTPKELKDAPIKEELVRLCLSNTHCCGAKRTK